MLAQSESWPSPSALAKTRMVALLKGVLPLSDMREWDGVKGSIVGRGGWGHRDRAHVVQALHVVLALQLLFDSETARAWRRPQARVVCKRESCASETARAWRRPQARVVCSSNVIQY